MATDNMKFHKKRMLVIFTGFCVTVFVLYSLTVSNLKTKKVKTNIFELDLYDDGDYDEKAKDEIVRKHLIDYPLIDTRVKIERLRPRVTPLVPRLLIKRNPPLEFTSSMTSWQIEENFFRYLETKDVICKDDKRLGFQHDGGYNVCFSPPFKLKKPCLVYSFGIYNDWNFDDAVSKIYKCTVFAFDPTIDVPEHNRSALIKFRRIGLGSKNEISRQGWKMMTFGSILKLDDNSRRVIDYLKFDIEYNEWNVLTSLYEEASLLNVKQIGFELHTNELFRDTKLPGSQTTKQDYIAMYRIIRNLERLNFKQFNYRRNPFGEFKSKFSNITRSCCYELHFINMNFVKKNYTIIES